METDMNDLIVAVRNVTKEYRGRDRNIIANNTVSFNVYRGEGIGIIGENGAGKTTLIKQIAGLVKTTRGDIVFGNGAVPGHAIGYMGQHRTDAFDHLTVEESLAYAAAFKGLSKAESAARMEELLAYFDLTGMRGQYVRTLSLGYKQLVDFCIAVIGKSYLLILDEPLSNLDAIHKQKIVNYLNGVVACNASIIIVSHNLYETENIITRVILMKNGRVIDDCPVAHIKQKYDKNVYLWTNSSISQTLKMKLFSFAQQNNYTIQSTINSHMLTVPHNQIDRLMRFIIQEEVYKHTDEFKLQYGSLQNVFINAFRE
jgi:ABC-2 type transport system ATP-binding protein